MTKNYEDAVLEAEAYLENEGDNVEAMVAIGYRAGLADGVQAVKDTAQSVPAYEQATRFYRVAYEKFAAVARKFEERAKDIGV